MKYLFLFLMSVTSVFVFAQSPIVAGQGYNQGELIYAKPLGFKAKIPAGWMGMLPQNSTIFLLSSLKGLDGAIYLLGDTTDFEQMKQGWAQGLELEEGRVLKSDEQFVMENNVLSSGVTLTGTDHTNRTGYIAARCGEYGRCVSALLICEKQYLASMSKSVGEFLESVEFVDPIMIQEYADYDWRQFLANKKLVHFENQLGTKSENEVFLCEDGTFRSKLKRKGVVKGDIGKYKGKHKGTWSTSSFGATGTLLLTFDKLPPVEVDLLIKDDHVFLNGKRHAALPAAMCN